VLIMAAAGLYLLSAFARRPRLTAVVEAVSAGPSRLQAAALVCGLAAATLALALARPRRR
jgi:hypothetical protein